MTGEWRFGARSAATTGWATEESHKRLRDRIEEWYRGPWVAEVSGGDHLRFVRTTCVAFGVATCSVR